MKKCKEYVIKVNIMPHPWDNPKNPYFWCIMGYYNDWCNEASGWSSTVNQAFEDALHFYNKTFANITMTSD